MSEETKCVCPNCGYCPHCGRGGIKTVPCVPYVPSYPYYPTYPIYPTTGPIWISIPTVTYGTASAWNQCQQNSQDNQ